MNSTNIYFWAKTTPEGKPGISVQAHCLNVGCVAEAIIATLSAKLRSLLPNGSATLAALHDVGKITIGFQAKCPAWLSSCALPLCPEGEIVLSVTDHARVSQHFLQQLPEFSPARLWAVAVGSHHGRPKGRKIPAPLEALPAWNDYRRQLWEYLQSEFGPLPTTPPDARFSPLHSDLWLLAGLITVADWIGSNEAWFPPETGLTPPAARHQAHASLRQIGWPGGKLRQTSFSAAFAAGSDEIFTPNPLQASVSEVAHAPGAIVVEGPMGCGKTEAALFAAQQLIAAGHQAGIYFALPTQVTSNRIHLRVARFLHNTLADAASFRLVHGNAWLKDDFDLRIHPSFRRSADQDGENPVDTAGEARSWFASAKQALLAPYGVGTVDQALLGIVAVKHFFVRRFALAGKVVILDEVHSYDIYTGTLITALIRELVSLRCSVIILSATLTADRRKELLAAAGVTESDAPSAYPLVTSGAAGGEARHAAPEWPFRKRITLRTDPVSEQEAAAELIQRAEIGQHVLWIRNTVIEAQEAFRMISGSIRADTVRVGLLHSRFPSQRRAELEDDWLERLGKHRSADGPGSILIATQVVEQSVDIDLDFIVSDLAPTDMLLQRLGRLWRHERPQRRAAVPEFWVRLPELASNPDAAELKKSLGRSARVYAPYVLLRTLSVWRTKSELNLPADIRPLLESTYQAPVGDEPASWKALHDELETEKNLLTANAEAATLVLGNPMLADKEEILTRRKGAPTVPVVLLHAIVTGNHGLTTLVALDGSQTEVSEYEWRRDAARFLHHWLVRSPRWMVPADAPKPRWLTLHGSNDTTVALVKEDGHCTFAENISAMIYDPRLGIFAESAPQPTPQTWKDDDDDEFDS
jgi:CRISPR-associated endonuclease/helicase Cas3